jgi:hypothetical protein
VSTAAHDINLPSLHFASADFTLAADLKFIVIFSPIIDHPVQ